MICAKILFLCTQNQKTHPIIVTNIKLMFILVVREKEKKQIILQ